MPGAFLESSQVMLARMQPEQALGDYTRGSLKLDKAPADFAGEMLYRLTASVLRRRVVGDQQTLTVHVPATWLDHWKASRSPRALRLLGASWGPFWYRRRWAVRFQAVSVTCSFASYDTYPMADVQLPPEKFGCPVRWDDFSLGQIVNPGRFRAAADIGSVSRGREYASRQRLGQYLRSSLWRSGIEHYNGSFSMADAVSEMLNTLERLGIHTGGLVQLDTLERTER
jgi:hypothetical protein